MDRGNIAGGMSYTGVLSATPPNLVIYKHAPTQFDGVGTMPLGTFWLHNTQPAAIPAINDLYILVSVAHSVATWVNFQGPVVGGVQTLSGTNGIQVFPILGDIAIRTAIPNLTVVEDVPGHQLHLDSFYGGALLERIQSSTDGNWTSPDINGDLILTAGAGMTINQTGVNEISFVSTAGVPAAIITTYNIPGNYVWHKAATTNRVEVYIWNGGGGGGSGYHFAAPEATGGGGSAGVAGCSVYQQMPAAWLGAAENVVVGAGGAGGAAWVNLAVSGSNNGAPGSSSSFANIIPSQDIPVLGGIGGLVNATGGLTFAPYLISLWGSLLYGTGGGAGVPDGFDRGGSIALNNILAPTGGGVGASFGLVFQPNGAFGGGQKLMDNTYILARAIGGAVGVGNPGANGAVGGAIGHGLVVGGCGGGGGGYGAAGGNGGWPGSPGAGGGASSAVNLASGAGGNGGDGGVIVIEYA